MQHTGRLDNWFETGTEGLVWVLSVDEDQHDERTLLYGTMMPIDHGDMLRVTAEDGSVIFDGIVVADFAEGWERYPRNPAYGQPAAMGRWIHWTQKGWRAHDWANLFIRLKPRAVLTKRPVEGGWDVPDPVPPPGQEDE